MGKEIRMIVTKQVIGSNETKECMISIKYENRFSN